MSTDPHRTIGVFGAGTYPRGFLPKLQRHADALGATDATLAWGVADFNRAITTATSFARGKDVIDVSVPLNEIRMAIGNANSSEVARANRQLTRPAMERLVQRIFETYRARSLHDGQAVWVQGLKTGHSSEAEYGLRLLKDRQPNLFICALSVIPDEADKRTATGNGWRLFRHLQQEGVIEGTILIDNRSPLVLSPGRNLDTQDEQVAHALASFIGAQRFNPRSPSLTETVRSLVKRPTPFVGLSIRIRDLVVGNEPFYWRAVRNVAGKVSPRGSGDVDNIAHVAALATQEAITEPACRTIDEEPDASGLVTVIYTIPLRRRDRRWPLVSSTIRSWLQTALPNATPIFVGGNGALDPHATSVYRLQVSVLYGLPSVPMVLGDLAPPDEPSSATAPEVNGHAPIDKPAADEVATIDDEAW